MRGFVVCGDCGHPLTACWSKSSTGKKYPYYTNGIKA
ncbi:MAG: zinc ribbon domain-containing protein [Cohaesibacter sp.]|nr:zinc ribbon domain-containing protein [Cohaesibacter sp.]